MRARHAKLSPDSLQLLPGRSLFYEPINEMPWECPDVMCYTAVNANFSKLIPTAAGAVAGQFVTWRYVSYGNVVCTPATKLYLKTHNSRDYH